MNDKTYLVCIELNSTATRDQFEKGGFGNNSSVVRLMENVYVFTASYMSTSEQIRDSIFNYMGSQNFNLLVIKTSVDAAWRLPINVDYWLKQYI